MRFGAASPDAQRVDLTAMIDVIFLLLIFWMTVARLAGGGRTPSDVATPESMSERQVAVPTDLLVVEVRRAAPVLTVGGREVDPDSLTSAAAAASPTHVLVRADAEANSADVRRALGALQRAGVRNVGLAVRLVQP